MVLQRSGVGQGFSCQWVADKSRQGPNLSLLKSSFLMGVCPGNVIIVQKSFPPRCWGARCWCRWWMQQWGPEGQKSERACNWFRRQSPHPSTTWEMKGQGNKCCQRQTHSNYTTTGPEHGFYFFCSEENSGGKNQPFVILCLRRALSFWMGEGGEESPSTAECR